jgi:hypothetical protein
MQILTWEKNYYIRAYRLRPKLNTMDLLRSLLLKIHKMVNLVFYSGS